MTKIISRLLRRTISFTQRQWDHLSAKANKMETSAADVVRRLIDEDIDKK